MDVVIGEDEISRCWWGASTPDYCIYHDEEWGTPVSNDRQLFEKICLEGFQSGLSWLTVLRKRDNFRKAFKNFDFEKVARFNSRSVDRLLKNSSIIRHKGKIEATINNARKACQLTQDWGSLAAYFWSFEPSKADRPSKFSRKELSKWTESEASRLLSKDLRRRGWKFVGPTTSYAFMQSMGIVNDHVEGCDQREVCIELRKKFKAPK